MDEEQPFICWRCHGQRFVKLVRMDKNTFYEALITEEHPLRIRCATCETDYDRSEATHEWLHAVPNRGARNDQG